MNPSQNSVANSICRRSTCHSASATGSRTLSSSDCEATCPGTGVLLLSLGTADPFSLGQNMLSDQRVDFVPLLPIAVAEHQMGVEE